MIGSLLSGAGMKVAAVGVVLLLAGGAYAHYTVVKNERDTALQQVGALQTAKAIQDGTIEAQKKALDEWKVQAAGFQKRLDEMAKVQMKASETTRKLNDVLSRHDLTALSRAKPALIERRINSGTADVFRMLKDASAHHGNQHPR